MDIEKFESGLVDKINTDIPSINLFNYDEEPKKRALSEYCLGRQGIARIKLDDFYLNNTYQLENNPKAPHKMYPCIDFIDFFNLGRYCIKNNISQSRFCQDAILEKIRTDIPKEDMITLSEIYDSNND